MNDNLIRLFQASLSPDPAHRKRAEEELDGVAVRDGFITACFQLVLAGQLDLATRQAASIFFKNLVKRTWDERSDNERAQVRNAIIPSLGLLPHSIRVQVLYSLGMILANDENGAWPDFSNVILTNIYSGQKAETLSGILALQEYCKIYQWRMSEKKPEAFARLLNEGFPKLLEFGLMFMGQQQQAVETDLNTLLLIKTSVKCFRSSIQSSVPEQFQDFGVLEKWLDFFMISCRTANLVFASHKNMNPSSLDMWRRIQKWSFYSLNHLFSRFGNSKTDAFRSGYKKFSKEFLQRFSIKLTQFALEQVENYINKHDLADKTLFVLISLLNDCLKAKTTWTVISPYSQLILDKFIFPLLCMTEEDEECWSDDPLEYIQRISDPLENFFRPASAAANFLKCLYEKKQASATVLEVLAQRLQNTPTPRDKDGALHALSILAESLLESENLRHQVPQIIQNFVLPELHSNVAILKSRACHVLGVFCANDAKEELQLFATSNGSCSWAEVFVEILKLLGEKEPLPVRISAATALERLMERESVQEIAENNVAAMLEAFLKLTNMIDLDILAEAMERLVQLFPEKIVPFASQLASQLAMSFLRIIEESKDQLNGDDLESSDKILTAMGILSTLNTIIVSVPVPSKPNAPSAPIPPACSALLAELENQTLPCINAILDYQIIDLYEECFSLLEAITYERRMISEQVWLLFPKICGLLDNDMMDYAENVFPTLDNFISFAPQIVASNAALKNEFMKIIHGILDSNLEVTEKIFGFKLIESLMLNCRGIIDDLVPAMLSMALDTQEETVSLVYKVHFIETMMNGFYYNPHMTFNILQQKGKLEAVMQEYLQLIPKMKRVHDKKLAILANLTLIQNAQELGLGEQVLPHIIGGLTELIKTLPAAEQARKEAQDLMDGESDDEEEIQSGKQFATNNGGRSGDLSEEEFDEEEEEELPPSALTDWENGNWGDDDDEEYLLSEELNVETPLDTINVRQIYKNVISTLQTQRPNIYEVVMKNITPADMEAISQVIQ